MDGSFTQVGFFVLVIILIIAGLIVSSWLSAKRRKELSLWAQSKGLTFNPDKIHSVDSSHSAFSCLRQGDNRYAYNIMTGRWSDRALKAFDYHYETHSTDSKGRRQTHHHYFSAVIIESAVPLKPLFMRPEGFFDKITEFVGFDDIDFESAEFSHKFYVKADDRKWAYDVIHARTMEFLLGMPQFTIQFDQDAVIAYRSRTFSTTDFESASEVVSGVLTRLPEYLVKQQTEGA